MAWISGKWYDANSRQNKIEKLRKYIVPRVRNLKKLMPDEKVDLKKYIDEFERLKAIDRGERDLLFFAYYYFGENCNPDNNGNWIPSFDVPDSYNLSNITEHAPQFHHEICDIMNVVSTKEINKRVAVAAPRSHAKSSFLSKGFPIHEICYRKRKYIIMISETPTVSSENLGWVKTQLQHNEKIRRDFGPLLHPKQQANPRDNNSEFIAWEDLGDGRQRQLTLVQAASSGQALRGRNWNGHRPDLIICDDLEDKRNTNTEQLRQELKDWFRQVVIPLGDPEGKKTAIVFMGTTVHHDSLLIDVMNRRSDFEKKLYKAIIEWPKRMDLWEQCREIYQNREDKKAAQNAELFYIANKEEMDRGSKVLWPSVQPLYKLMTKKWDDGSKAFNTEYMNNPVDEESMVFNPDKFTYWDGKVIGDFSHENYEIYMGVDFAMGKQRGDFSAISVIAKHKENGVSYVVDSYGERIHPDKFLKVICDYTLKWQPDGIAAEAQAAQEFFVFKLKEALQGTGYPAQRRVKEIHQRSRKELRIESMLPDIESGKLQFTKKHVLLLEQFERYGTNSHDDLIDSLEMALSVSKKRVAKVIDKPEWLY
ncbi:phage terminase large subunit [Fictibacillus sp. Mic-4]|uniref:phage terminase large subunit n=1 Tax=Fictibacillus sp. Mic-4 TaxID=3132826 RepID=UPI003CEDAA1F